MKQLFTLVVFFIGLNIGLYAQTNVSGFITTDSTWTVDGSPYEVISNLQITSSGSLTIDPGVEVWIEANTSIIVDGDLVSNGTTGDRVLFTSRKAPGSRAKGDWNEINVRSGGLASFNATTIEYGGYSSSYNIGYSCLSSTGGAITVSDNCIIKDSNNTGVEVGNVGNVQIEGAQITACRWPIVYGSVANLNFNDDAVDILGNTFNGIFIDFGSINNDMTLDTISVPYVFNKEMDVESSSTLTVRAGNIIKINCPSINVYGTLVVNGSLAERVYFTSYQNDGRGGDTNNDGASTVAAPGNWDDIYVPSGGVATFNATTIEYGGYGSTYSISHSCLYNNGGTVTLDVNSVIAESRNVGLRLNNGGNTHIENAQITDCRWPIVYVGASDLTFLHNDVDISDNTFNGAYIDFTNLNETMVLDTLNVPYVINRNLYVMSSATLRILAGNIIKFNNDNIYVRGGLIANGSKDDIIYFTSYQNDNLGGDTNNDGAATPPAAGNWGSIRFEDSSDDAQCSITYADFSFGGRSNRAPVWVQNASPTIENCNFENNYIGAYIEYDSSPSFRYNTIGSSSLVPFALTLDATPDFTDNTFSFSDNEYDAIGLISSTMVASATLPQRDVTGIPNVTYLLLGAVTIPEAITLTIDPGVVIKGMNRNHLFIVEGTLIADGQDEGNRITFTSVYDDTFGNPSDTNKDGSQTDPAIGNWGGIVFENTSDDEQCVLNYTRLQYGAMPSRYYNTQHISNGEVTLENASPVITNNIIKDCHYGVYAFQASHSEVLNNEFVNTTYTPVAQSINAMPRYEGNTFVNPGWTAIGIIGEKLGFDATLDKDTIAGHENISYVLLDDLTINSGTYVEVKPGIVLKFNQNKAITVDGGFKCSGLDNDSITFTSIKDDNYGVPQDTKNDGDAESPSSGDWSTVRYTGTADDDYNHIIYTRLLYGGGRSYYGVVTWVDAGGSIAASLISDSYYYGLRFDGVSTPDCSDRVIIQNCRYDPIAQSLLALPDMSFTSPDIASNGNGSNGIFILEGDLSSSAELVKQDVGGIYNIAYIIDRLTIGENAVLTIEPGVVIKFRDYYSRITVDGALTANGTPDEKIVFTSIKDDSKGGDTNDDGFGSTPQKNNWDRIIFNASALEEYNLLNNCILNYGAHTYSNWGKNRSMVDIFDAFVEVDSVQVEHSNHGGIGIFGSSDAVITNSQFNNIDEAPVIISMFAEPEFENNGVSNLGIVAIGVAQETYSLDDTIPQRDFAGIEDITYYIYNTLTVNSGTNIVIPAGTIFKTDGRSAFNVNGALQVNGEPGKPVVFTDLKDDAYGHPEDTNDNGSADSPSIQNVPVITYQDISNDDSCSVENAIFRYARCGINMEQAAPDIDASLFENCTWGVELRGVSTPALTNSTFNDLSYAPMVISLVSFPRDTVNNVISGTTYKAIGILANEELVQDVTLQKNNFGGVRNIPYYFSGDYSIGTSVNLSVDPGVICKFNRDARLTVKRGLIAEGGATADSVIVFTDIKDDFFGGDTDSNGPYTYNNNYQNWDGILFTDEAYDDSCRLDHCVIRYAGYSSTEAAVATAKASPLITNSSLTYNANGVRATGASDPIINYCDIFGNKYYGVQNVDQAFIIDARYNYWGSDTGPTHASNPGGTGDAVTDRVDYSDFTTGGFTNPLMGDVSLNGHIQAYDASLILQHAASVITLSDLQQLVADVSGEAGITAYDASLVLQYVSGIISSFPAEVIKSARVALVDNAVFFSLDDCYPEGKEFSSQLEVRNSDGLLAADITLRFNPAILQLKQVNEGDMNTLMAYSIDNEAGMVDLAFAVSESEGGDGLLAVFDFEVVTGMGAETAIGFEELLVNEQDLISSSKDGVVILPINTLWGDIEITIAALHQVHPNPSSGFMEFYYDVPDDNSEVTVSAYAPDGTLITTLFAGSLDKGRYHYGGSDLDGYHGVIIIRLVVDDQLFTQKVVIK